MPLAPTQPCPIFDGLGSPRPRSIGLSSLMLFPSNVLLRYMHPPGLSMCSSARKLYGVSARRVFTGASLHQHEISGLHTQHLKSQCNRHPETQALLLSLKVSLLHRPSPRIPGFTFLITCLDTGPSSEGKHKQDVGELGQQRHSLAPCKSQGLRNSYREPWTKTRHVLYH